MNSKYYKCNREYKNFTISGWGDYELIDSGNKKKLERFGPIHLIRFEPRATWEPSLNKKFWKTASAEYTLLKGETTGTWTFRERPNPSWIINIDGLRVLLTISKSRHIGIFPEQFENWRWIQERINASNKKIDILNLFGYTGIATLLAARAGARVTHVDASRRAMEIGKNSASLSGLTNKPIRWIIDDVPKFIKREIRRGRKYDGIIMDPPKFGRGPKGEIWKFNKSVNHLLSQCSELLTTDPTLFIITAYNVDCSPEEISLWLNGLMNDFSGKIEYGNLVQQEKSSGKKIHQAFYARWSST
ncbi:MAG: class I SAM-dependent methyltransferase [Anaerolineaceae bacterium]|nr:class I SAM-dependent methyltransferase [Anaerolineaceae bacterium]